MCRYTVKLHQLAIHKFFLHSFFRVIRNSKNVLTCYIMCYNCMRELNIKLCSARQKGVSRLKCFKSCEFTFRKRIVHLDSFAMK